MLRKLMLGLVAAASLSTIALAPTAASAKPWGGGGGWGFHHHFHSGFSYIGGGYGDDGCYVTRTVITPFGYRRRIVNVCGY